VAVETVSCGKGVKRFIKLMMARYYAITALAGMIPWLIRNRIGVSWPKVVTFLNDLRANEGASLPIGIAGFCWGGKHTFYLSQDRPECKTAKGQPLADALFTAHPSNLVIPGDIETVRTNISVAVGDQDFGLKMDKVEQIKQILAKLENVDSEVVVYPGAGHGFAIRADHTNNPKAVEQANDSEKQAIAWFQRQFAKVNY
jgi:dienelactone hydrolase